METLDISLIWLLLSMSGLLIGLLATPIRAHLSANEHMLPIHHIQATVRTCALHVLRHVRRIRIKKPDQSDHRSSDEDKSPFVCWMN
ncbi:hypothetical protein [Paenibacillus taiwanensis]|uniref:hypothetical protein n=1 Tax=Paenibacillus taiwanensis TaxID=401638 RepID=UPI00040FE574|nr:hypothetical protein [Paenibacillus taiwanensis]